jgi:predicted DNA-binding transcriptional regulator AlpA
MSRVTESDVLERLDQMQAAIQNMGAVLNTLQAQSMNDRTRGHRIDEVARRLTVHPQTVFKWIREGKFPPGLKVGNRTIWTEEMLATWMTQQQAKSPGKRRERTPEQCEASRTGMLRYWALRRAAQKTGKRLAK